MKVKNPVVCAKFPTGSKFHFSQRKIYFTEFIDKFLKFEEMKYTIHHVKSEILPALRNFAILCSNSSIDSKLLLLNLGLRLHFQVFPNFQRDQKLRFLNFVPAGIVNFSKFTGGRD